MGKPQDSEVTATINEMFERGIDASHLRYEIAEVIDELGQDYDAEHDWEEVYDRLFG